MVSRGARQGTAETNLHHAINFNNVSTTICTGKEKTLIDDEFDSVPSYTGNLHSPLPWIILREHSSVKALGIQINFSVANFQKIDGYVISSRTVRGWIKDASKYHGIPHLLLAVILQQENGPNATELQKILQFSERIITSLSNINDELLDLIPDKISGGSTGFANMSRTTLKNTVEYTQKTYGRHPVPHDEQLRAVGDGNLPDLPGYDWKHDLYYAAAHIRQLIHQATNQACHSGILTKEQMKKVFSLYNGKGDAAAKYGNDAMQRIAKALTGDEPLFFYER